MDRRRFLQNLAATPAAMQIAAAQQTTAAPADITGHTLLCEFAFEGVTWKVYEDLRTRDGALTFVSSKGGQRILSKPVEPTFAGAEKPYLGLTLAEIGLSNPDLLADKLLAGGGDPDEEQVRIAAPPLGSGSGQNANPNAPPPRLPWNTFVGTKECYDTMPVYPQGNTRTYHPSQYFTELRQPGITQKRFEGMLGGWMPAVRKVVPVAEGIYIELVIFGDVEAKDRFIVQTWHRSAKIENGKVTKVVYGYSYPAYPPARVDPKPEDFYRGLLVFTDYWDRQLRDFAPTVLPKGDWVDMSKHAVAKEIMVRPGGVYPKYGAVDRDYYGPEYDGFQDIFTSAVFTNLELGRFESARAIIDNYFTDFVDAKGMVNMRGPETAQFGMTLSALAKYFHYTRDGALLNKFRGKIEATAAMLGAMHDVSLKLPADDPGRGLIAGWSESDAALAATPEVWWKPYYANSAFTVRGLRDIARVWPELQKHTPAADRAAQDWLKRAQVLQDATLHSIEKNIKRDMKPPYIGPMPGTTLPFREALAQEWPSPQQWPHRPYAELLHADILPHGVANLVADCMRAYGATTMGVLANVSSARAGGRAILGFIAYGHAQMLLRLDRIEEYLLFLYAHRYHDHTPGSWTAGEVSGIGGGTAIFCIPAQQTIPLMLRWMLVLEDSDEDRLYFGKAIPKTWTASAKPISITQAPTRWGRVNFQMQSARAVVELTKGGSTPKEIQVKLRTAKKLTSATVNGKAATLGGLHGDTVTIATGAERRFEVSAV
ncbi:MAG: Tat pathway signal protein [Candidatus Solibacter sp.]